MNVPQTGVNEQKAKFFRETSQTFEFLSVFHSLSADKQLDLVQFITLLQGKK